MGKETDEQKLLDEFDAAFADGSLEPDDRKDDEESETPEHQEEEAGGGGDGEPEGEPDKVKELQEELDKAVQRQKSLEGQMKDYLAWKESQSGGGKADEEEQETADEDLEWYKKEYGFIASQEEKLRTKLKEQIRKEILEEMEKKIAPTASEVSLIAAQRHFSAIKDIHPDFEKFRDDGSLKKWIDQMPDWKRPAYDAAYSDGTTEQVIGLIQEFKDSKGIKTDPKASARNDIEAVPSRTRPVQPRAKSGTIDKDDFDGAFEAAAAGS